MGHRHALITAGNTQENATRSTRVISHPPRSAARASSSLTTERIDRHHNAGARVRGVCTASPLDAFSAAVTSTVQQVGDAVVSLNIPGSNPSGNYGAEAAGSAGSGVIFAPDGYLLTNAHVVGIAKQMSVTLTDGRSIVGTTVGTDPSTDLAVVRVNAGGLPFAALGDSDKLQAGQLVVAIGNPLGFQSTVSAGVVSALGRSLRAKDGQLIEGIIQAKSVSLSHSAHMPHTAQFDRRSPAYITQCITPHVSRPMYSADTIPLPNFDDQTDVALNPGNSGGPLVDTSARVVGINTAIIANAQNLSFSVPSNTAQWVVSEILSYGKVRRSYLGLGLQSRPVKRQFQTRHGFEKNHVLVVLQVCIGVRCSHVLRVHHFSIICAQLCGSCVAVAWQLCINCASIPIVHQLCINCASIPIVHQLCVDSAVRT